MSITLLAGEAPWRSAIVREPNSDAHVLPGATSSFTPRDVIDSDAVSRLLGDCARTVTWSSSTARPIFAVAETRVLSRHRVIVARAGRSHVGAVGTGFSQTEAAGGEVLGIAPN